MITKEQQEAITHLHEAYLLLAPKNDETKNRISNMRKVMNQEGMDGKEQCRHVAGTLYDGLAYGNW